MINEETFKANIAKNLSNFRKQKNLTQAELANKLNYSDKAISKWERGESLPDVYTLNIIADFFGVTLNDLCYGSNTNIKKDTKKTISTRHFLITLLSISLVWFIATLLFVSLLIFVPNRLFDYWKIFIVAIPISFIVFTVFSCIWYNYLIRSLSISCLVWTTSLTIHLLAPLSNSVFIYFIAIPFQVIIILWFILRHIKYKN